MNYKVFKSPGRINLIGEHTDYNGGYVLPAAIDRYTYVTIEESNHFEATTDDLKRSFSFDLNDEKLDERWANYVKGAVLHLSKHVKKALKPCKIEIKSTLPMGAGLSSSASLMVGIIYAIAKTQRIILKREEIALIAHEAENQFVGVNCGIMDQYAVSLGKKDSFIFIDALNGNYRYISAKGFPKITVVDSTVKHELSNGSYNTRRDECAQAVKEVGLPFRQMNMEILDSQKAALGETVYMRARHVIEENERVLKTISAIKAHDWKSVGKYLKESHVSLREFFEVSTEEIDFLVDKINGLKDVYGARMIGGGFGGSIIILSDKNIDQDLLEISREYMKTFRLNMKYYPVKMSSGVRKI